MLVMKKGTRRLGSIIAMASDAGNGKHHGFAFIAMGFIAANACSTTIAGNELHGIFRMMVLVRLQQFRVQVLYVFHSSLHSAACLASRCFSALCGISWCGHGCFSASFLERFDDSKVRVMAERIQMADHVEGHRRRINSEVDAEGQKAAWAEWGALPIGFRLRWHARKRFLMEWTAALLFGFERVSLERVFTGWHVVLLNAVESSVHSSDSAESSDSTCDTDAEGDAS